MKRLLIADPELDEEEFAVWLQNYMCSQDHPPGERPYKFLPRIHDYSVGPLDRFRRSFGALIMTARDQARLANAASFAKARRQLLEASDEANNG